ncbi:NAD(P)/FAD-dependent oxidoreductase [Brevibacterium rongguiense]|nr:NAD(P)/FAD-dependent oxidoreductase [Brevibacterium rongguiense]
MSVHAMDAPNGHKGVDMTNTIDPTAGEQHPQAQPDPAAEDPQAATAAVQDWLDRFDRDLKAGDLDALRGLFAQDCYWRDFVAFTWNLTTLEGFDAIADMLTAQLPAIQPQGWQLAEPASGTAEEAEAWVDFSTAVGRGWAHLRLVNGKCWTLLTTLQELTGFEEKKGPKRELGVQHEITRGRTTWKEARAQRDAALGYEEQPYVLIIGGGQGGIGLAARLRRLGVPAIVVEKNERAGDSWRNRYKSLHLHDPVWYDHMPYLPFPDDWPVFPSKDKMGDWLEHYVDIMELDYWSGTECETAQFDEASGTWTVRVNRRGEEVELHPTQLVFALGVSGYPNIPHFEGAEDFTGWQGHSSEFTGDEDSFEGKRAVVIGSNNSAHDIAATLWEKGAEVTMIQRSSTHISRSDSLRELALGPLYSEEALAAGVTTEKADMLFASWPYRLLPGAQIPVYEEMKRRDADFYQALADAGFELDFGEDESGLFLKYLRRGSGYYIDVGASQLIIDGRIRLERGQVTKIAPDGVVVDGDRLIPADLIVYATGYGSMNAWLADLVSPEVADAVGKCWGYGSDTIRDPGPWEGELRNMWKPTNVEQLWIHGGNLHQSRHYSKYLALQLKAREQGIETPVYGLQESHHTR